MYYLILVLLNVFWLCFPQSRYPTPYPIRFRIVSLCLTSVQFVLSTSNKDIFTHGVRQIPSKAPVVVKVDFIQNQHMRTSDYLKTDRIALNSASQASITIYSHSSLILNWPHNLTNDL
jgi:hypothetical protein